LPCCALEMDACRLSGAASFGYPATCLMRAINSSTALSTGTF
jgi:hypothetical protein